MNRSASCTGFTARTARASSRLRQWTPALVYLLVVLIIAYKIIQFYMGLYGPHSDLSNILKGF